MLNGGNGMDTLTGGSGADTFVLRRGNEQSTITDFNLALCDKIVLGGGSGGYSALSFSCNDILLDGATLATISGVNTSSLTANQFALA